MSGRKASEVNSLLSSTKNARNSAINTLNVSFEKFEDIADVTNKSIDKYNKKIKELKNISLKSIEEEFPDAAKKIQGNKKNILQTHFENINVDSDEKDVLMNRYKQTDKEADEVRDAIKRQIQRQGRGDPWHCDKEYSDARKVQQRYDDLKKDVGKLQKKYASGVMESKETNAVILSKTKEIEAFITSCKNLSKTADNIKELRNKATEAKNTIKSEMNKIDKKVAAKFMDKEYKELVKQTSEYLGLDDQKITDGFSAEMSKIAEFTNELNEKYSSFLERKESVRALIESLSDQVNSCVFKEPLDEFKSIDNPEKLSVCDFLHKYDKDDLVIKIKKNLKSANDKFNTEEFDRSEKIIRDTEQLVNEAMQMAHEIYENRYKTIDNMLIIQEKMKELGYNINVIENGNFSDGYCVECKAGEEVIKFDRVTVIDGKPVIDIDHKEATKGTCHKPWLEIRRSFAEEGLILEDITKNGISINQSNSISNRQRENEKNVSRL